jgi:FMN phosphatase YigB (HAD superfamily)
MKKRIYCDMDDTLCHFEKAFHKSLELNPKQPYPQSQWGFFLGLEPYDGAIEGFRKLEEKYDVWILTKPSTKNLNCYTEKAKWIYDHLGQDIVDKLIICPDKALIKGDYLIDDKIWSGFEGEQLHFGSEKFPDWKTVVDYLMKMTH